MYIQRVQRTAKLTGIKASCVQRQKIADYVHQKYCDDVKKKLSKNKQLLPSDIEKIVSKYAPGIDFSLAPLSLEDIKNRYIAVLTSFSGDGFKSISSFVMAVNLNNDPKVLLENLQHEGLHLFSRIYEPKLSASILTLKLQPHKCKMANDFYKRVLYVNELEKVPKEKLANYDRESEIKSTVNKLFKDGCFSQMQKIRTLQHWRYILIDEHKAYSYNSKNLEKLENERFYLHKVRVIEQILIDEMAKAGHDVSRFSSKS